MHKVPYCLCTHLNFTWLKFSQSKIILLVELLREVRRKVLVLLTEFSHHLSIRSADCVPIFPFKAYFCYNRHHPFLLDQFLQKLSCLHDFHIMKLYFLCSVHCFPVPADTTSKATLISQTNRETQTLRVLIWVGDLTFKIWIGRNGGFLWSSLHCRARLELPRSQHGLE